jgi:hypothetical protein
VATLRQFQVRSGGAAGGRVSKDERMLLGWMSMSVMICRYALFLLRINSIKKGAVSVSITAPAGVL